MAFHFFSPAAGAGRRFLVRRHAGPTPAALLRSISSVRPASSAAGRRLTVTASVPYPIVSHPATTFRLTPFRPFSSVGADGAATSSSEARGSGSDEKNRTKPKDEDSNIFLDNLGKIFLGSIAAVVLTLVRSSKGATARNALRDSIEERSALDPLEVDDLRVANSEFTPDVFDSIVDEVWDAFPNGTAGYDEFVSVVLRVMRRMKGEAFTVELGHMIDRAYIAAIEERGSAVEGEGGGFGRGLWKASDTAREGLEANGEKLPLPFLLALLSLALNSGPKERILALYRVLHQADKMPPGEVDSSSTRISKSDAVAMVGYLQATCQLVPDAQVVESDVKYPIQEYRRGTADELVSRALSPDKKKGGGSVESLSDREREDIEFDLRGFEQLLRSHAVCAWGECYSKKKNL